MSELMDKVSEAREKLKNCKRQDETVITLSKRELEVIYTCIKAAEAYDEALDEVLGLNVGKRRLFLTVRGVIL